MDFEGFLTELELPVNAQLDAVESAFTEKLRVTSSWSDSSYSDEEFGRLKAVLSQDIKIFFAFALSWAEKQAAGSKGQQNHENAVAIKKQAGAMLPEFQSYIRRFVICYLTINGYMKLVREEIAKNENRFVHSKNVKWTPDAGALLERYRQDKIQLTAEIKRLHKALGILPDYSALLDEMEPLAGSIFGKSKAEKMVRSFMASLRILNITRAKKNLKEMVDQKKRFGVDQKQAQKIKEQLEKSGMKIIDFVEKEKDLLQSEEGRIFLTLQEAQRMIQNDLKELNNIREFLRKYYLPYMEYKLEALSHLRDKLLVKHSVDSLFMIYCKLINGIISPLADITDVRDYEAQVLNPCKFILSSHAQELDIIYERADEIVQEFSESKEELSNFEEIDLEDVNSICSK